MSAYDSYDAIASLDDAELRVLLRSGGALERLWAAWALGMRIGAASLPDVRAAVEDTPVAGLRRHLAVVLAGLGERGMVEVLALSDPDEFVRATAGVHLVRTAREGGGPAAVERLLYDAAPHVRFDVLQELLDHDADWRRLLVSRGHLERLSADRDLAVRRLAVNGAAGLMVAELPTSLFSRRLGEEPDGELRLWIAERLIGLGYAAEVLRAVRGTADDRNLDLLRVLVDHRQRFPWSELARLALRDQPEIDAQLTSLLADDDLSALPWLFTCVLRMERFSLAPSRDDWETYPPVHAAAEHAEVAIDTMLAFASGGMLKHRSLELSRRLVTYVEQRLVEAEDDARSDDEEDETLDRSNALRESRALDELRASDWYRKQLQLLSRLRALTS